MIDARVVAEQLSRIDARLAGLENTAARIEAGVATLTDFVAGISEAAEHLPPLPGLGALKAAVANGGGG